MKKGNLQRCRIRLVGRTRCRGIVLFCSHPRENDFHDLPDVPCDVAVSEPSRHPNCDRYLCQSRVDHHEADHYADDRGEDKVLDLKLLSGRFAKVARMRVPKMVENGINSSFRIWRQF